MWAIKGDQTIKWAVLCVIILQIISKKGLFKLKVACRLNTRNRETWEGLNSRYCVNGK